MPSADLGGRGGSPRRRGDPLAGRGRSASGLTGVGESQGSGAEWFWCACRLPVLMERTQSTNSPYIWSFRSPEAL
ncbi:MAG: hypothetical protein J0M33_13530 [Anaerolineae bacterium]|nr:hypothetical protein [Anaerolineae bacterium]